MMVLCGTIHAQSTWTTEKVEADELRGIEGGESYLYSVDSIGTIKIADWKKDRITITTNEGVFAYTKNQVNNPVTNPMRRFANTTWNAHMCGLKIEIKH